MSYKLFSSVFFCFHLCHIFRSSRIILLFTLLISYYTSMKNLIVVAYVALVDWSIVCDWDQNFTSDEMFLYVQNTRIRINFTKFVMLSVTNYHLKVLKVVSIAAAILLFVVKTKVYAWLKYSYLIYAYNLEKILPVTSLNLYFTQDKGKKEQRLKCPKVSYPTL
jgi:hypothetical protein